MNPSRRLFIANTSGSAMALALAGCGGGDGGYSPTPPPLPPPPAATGCSATAISANHGHVLTIPAADLVSPLNKTYNIAGAAGHDHFVVLAPVQLQQIKSNVAVTVTSSLGDAHTHEVTVNCS